MAKDDDSEKTEQSEVDVQEHKNVAPKKSVQVKVNKTKKDSGKSIGIDSIMSGIIGKEGQSDNRNDQECGPRED